MNTPATNAPHLRRIRICLAIIIAGLLLSGVTAFPLLEELNLLANWLVGPDGSLDAAAHTGLTHWILRVRAGLESTYAQHPFIAYGTDWLAFGHIVIALFFIPVWLAPRRYIGNLWVGLAACAGVFAIAFICGPLRGIPFAWRLVDCSFGVLAAIPILLAIRWARQLPD